MATDKEVITVFITKYALTEGILKKIVETTLHPSMVCVVDNNLQAFHGEGKEWHRTMESAKARATKMRDDKIKSLEKQLQKIRALTF